MRGTYSFTGTVAASPHSGLPVGGPVVDSGEEGGEAIVLLPLLADVGFEAGARR